MARRRGRNVHGVLLLDKPVGFGSNEVLQQVKRLFEARKAGHTGSLDRLASGLLPICFGEATKLSGFLLNADKRYRAVFRLGVTTTTGDAEGEVVATREAPQLSEATLRAVLARFTGEIRQIPPMHSAVKHHGERLYRLAHRGLVVEREPRAVTVHRFELLALSGDRLEVDIHCSKGTYIRTLAEDVGEALGCGASVAELRRVGSGPFDASGMVTLDELHERAERGGLAALDETLLPLEAVLDNCPRVTLSSDVAFYLRQGQPVLVPHAPTEGLVKIFEGNERFLGVGEVLDDGRIAPRRLVRT